MFPIRILASRKAKPISMGFKRFSASCLIKCKPFYWPRTSAPLKSDLLQAVLLSDSSPPKFFAGLIDVLSLVNLQSTRFTLLSTFNMRFVGCILCEIYIMLYERSCMQYTQRISTTLLKGIFMNFHRSNIISCETMLYGELLWMQREYSNTLAWNAVLIFHCFDL